MRAALDAGVNFFDTADVSSRGESEEILGRALKKARVALAWLRQRPGVTAVIIGARNIDQLEDNLKAADLELTAEELEKLTAPTAPHLPYPQWMIAWQSGQQRPPGR